MTAVMLLEKALIGLSAASAIGFGVVFNGRRISPLRTVIKTLAVGALTALALAIVPVLNSFMILFILACICGCRDSHVSAILHEVARATASRTDAFARAAVTEPGAVCKRIIPTL